MAAGKPEALFIFAMAYDRNVNTELVDSTPIVSSNTENGGVGSGITFLSLTVAQL